jgi:hypothetical protein
MDWSDTCICFFLWTAWQSDGGSAFGKQAGLSNRESGQPLVGFPIDGSAVWIIGGGQLDSDVDGKTKQTAFGGNSVRRKGRLSPDSKRRGMTLHRYTIAKADEFAGDRRDAFARN